MNKEEQIKFIVDNYPLYTNHISNRRIRHSFFSNIETELQAYLLGFYAAENNINLNMNYLKRDDMYRICTSSKKEILKLFNLLYLDSNFYLGRKFNKFNYYVNTEVSQIIADHRNALEVNDSESNNPPKSPEQSNTD